MAKFKEQHSDAEAWQQFESNGDEVVKVEQASPCALCQEPSYFVSISFQATFCSDECLERFWEGYFDALNDDSWDDGNNWLAGLD